jgi:D-glycero-alpha-D-manno-heptose-7-phosphate kinase
LHVPATAAGESVLATAPCRADLAGGTLDLWPLYLFHPGAVTVNFALNILTRCRITPQPGRAICLKALDLGRQESFASLDKLGRARRYRHPLAALLVRHFRPQTGLLLETHSASPAGAGISGSSALMVAVAAALARFTGRKMDREALRQVAQNVEAQVIGVPTGCQDYYPALYGGVSAIWLEVEGVRHETLAVAPEEMDRRFLLAYTGAPRQSGINNWEVFQRHIGGDARVVRNFQSIAQIAQAMRQALVASAWSEVARLLREEWKLRRANYPGISTPLIDRLMAAARRHGAEAAKVCGAGGGGCVLFMAEPDARERVAQALAAAGGTVLPMRVSRRGLTVAVRRGAALSPWSLESAGGRA